MIYIILAAIEAASRIFLYIKNQTPKGTPHTKEPRSPRDPWEMINPDDPSMLILRPGFHATKEQLIKAENLTNNKLAMKLFAENEKAGDRWDITINKFGFRGHEIEKQKTKKRIMTIGDSCTFGMLVGDKFTYPSIMENTLRDMGYDVEVINAGVERHTTENVLKRLDYYLSFNPDIVTIYIGWDDFYFRPGIKKLSPEKKHFPISHYSAAVYLIRKSISNLLMSRYGKMHIYYDRNDKEAAKVKNYKPPFLSDVIRIVEQIKDKGATPVIITLPGLFLSDQAPSEKVLKMRHLPPFSHNAYVFAKMTSNYNDSLRKYSQRNNIYLIDLDKWSEEAFKHREKWFFDSVHPLAAAQLEIGKHLATQIQHILKKSKNKTTETQKHEVGNHKF